MLKWGKLDFNWVEWEELITRNSYWIKRDYDYLQHEHSYLLTNKGLSSKPNWWVSNRAILWAKSSQLTLIYSRYNFCFYCILNFMCWRDFIKTNQQSISSIQANEYLRIKFCKTLKMESSSIMQERGGKFQTFTVYFPCLIFTLDTEHMMISFPPY